jgi:hypothetical protein
MDPALLELLGDESVGGSDEVEAIIRVRAPEVGVPGVRLVSRFGTIATCRLSKDDVLAVRAHENVVSLKAPRPLGPEPAPPRGHRPRSSDATVRDSDRRRPPIPSTGAGVVVGVVDWGCDVDHPALKHPNGTTRVRALWDQRGSSTEGAPRPYGYGTVHHRRQIDAALRTSDPYAALGYHPADADRGGSGAHGTHVMDIAAGNGLAGGPIGIAPEADLVFVHLADRGTSGLANLGDSLRILEAVDFISRIAGPKPWVINASLGRHGGPHDGSTLVEMALGMLLSSSSGRCCVLSAGNYFEKQTHTSGRLRSGDTAVLDFTTAEDDLTPNELEVWYSGRDELAVQLESPTGESSPWIELGGRGCVADGSCTVGRLYHRARDPNNDDNHVDLFLDPQAPAGSWTLRLQARTIRDGTFHAWLERDEACSSCQTRFVVGDTDPLCTLGTLASGHLPLVVGAYDPHTPTRPLARFSSSGPTRDGRQKPDILAPGVQILAARSAPAGASRSPGEHTRKSGTSMSAPHVTGAVAVCLGLQAPHRLLSAAEIREVVLATADHVAGGEEEAHRRGCGYLDIDALIAAVSSTGRARTPHRHHRPRIDAKEHLMEPTVERSPSLPMSPDRVYREIIYASGAGVPPSIDADFVVLARPGERPAAPPEAGDVLVRVALGEAGRGRVGVLCGPASTRGDGSDGPGLYAAVGDWDRRVLDQRGRVPHGQVLLRPRPQQAADDDVADLADDLAESDQFGTAEGSSGVGLDAAAAIPPFSTSERSNVQTPLLNRKRSADAVAWTRKVHDAQSGVTVSEIESALANYVDRPAIAAAIAAHNTANPGNAVDPGTAPVDAVLVEMVHQFQLKCYAEQREHDGRAGESTLDSLGLIARKAKAFNRTDRANPMAQDRLDTHREKLDKTGRPETSASTWFEHMVDPSILGRRTKKGNGIHVVLARKLRRAERHLLTLPAFRGMTPVRLGRELGIVEKHGGARPDDGTSLSMHTFGLAVDIAYTGNPWLRQPSSWRALQRAALLKSGVVLRQRTAALYFHSLGSDPGRSTGSIWDELRQRSDDLGAYFRLAEDPSALTAVLQTRQAAATVGVFRPGETVAAAAERWRLSMRQDLHELQSDGRGRARAGDFRRHSAPSAGFLGLRRELVIALRDHACLAWGAVDIGPDPHGRLTGSGDIMHFDARIGGVGAIVAAGKQYLPTTGHPCMSKPAAPEPHRDGEENEEYGETFELGGFDRSLLGDDQHGAGLAGVTELSTRLTRVLPGSTNGDGRADLAEFDAPEHGLAGDLVQQMIDTWAMNGLIDGGAFIDTRKHLTADKRDQPIVSWQIFTPLLTRTSEGKLVTYTDLGGRAHPHAHWYYIAPDPIGHPRPWNPGTLKKALLAGEAVALSIGQIILLAGDLYGSFEELTGRGSSGGRSRPAVNLLAGIDANEPWAFTLLSLSQFPEFDWQIDALAALNLMRDVAGNYERFERELRTGGRERFQQVRGLIRFLRSARGSTRFTEAHVLARVLEVKGTVTHRQVQLQAPWMPDRLVPPRDKQYEIQRDPFHIGISNGHYLDLALKNRRHFSPLNWATFEAYHRRALETIGRGMAQPRSATVRHPIPADAIALTAFGCHFLTDAFASGHMRTPVAQLGPRGALASKIMHDFDNRYGLLVENARGQRWRAFGDEYLHPGGAGDVRSVQSAVLQQLAARRPRGFDLSADANRDRMMEAVGVAFRQLHYEAQRQGRVLSGNPFGFVLAANRGQLAADEPAKGMPHDATTLIGRIDADIDAKMRYLKQHQPRPLPAGTDPVDVLANHPPLLVRGTDRQRNDIAIVPPKTPYRWFDRLTHLNMDRWLRLRWHGRTLEQQFSDYFHLEEQLRRHPPPWMPAVPDRVRSLVARELPEE